MGYYLSDVSMGVAIIDTSPGLEETIMEGKSGVIGDLLPLLSESAANLPLQLLYEDTPIRFRNAVIHLYMELSEFGSIGSVDTDDLTFDIYEFLEECARGDFLDASEECELDLDVCLGDEDSPYWEYFSELFYSDPLYIHFVSLAQAIQETEGLMTYTLSRDGRFRNVVAPVQCGVMDLYEGA